MEINQRRIDELIAHPSESLNVEIKRWIDPATPEGTAKIVKAAQALRNRNGGFLILGFDDKTLQPDVGNAPADPRAVFHLDVIQAIVSRYSSVTFEVRVMGQSAGSSASRIFCER
jgi:predicted HTH transcriptional regulator